LVCLATVFTVATSTAVAELVAYYPFNEGSGNVAGDATGNGHDGDFVSSGIEWVESLEGYGTALLFPGNPSPGPFVDIGTWDPSGHTDMLSVAVWIKWEGITTDYQGIMGKRDGWNDADTCWHLELNIDTGNIAFGSYNVFPNFGTNIPPIGEWQHVAVTFDGETAIMYIDGEEVGRSTGFSFGPKRTARLVIGVVEGSGWNPFNGTIDDVRIYDTGLSAMEVMDVFGGPQPIASKPRPSDQANNVYQNVVLSWTPGIYATTHDVYFGTNFDDVNNAKRDSIPQGVQANLDQVDTSYDPPGLLEFSQTYYWRVDEVNGPDVWKGKVWSFTVEPFVYPIQNITATASSSHSTNMGPENTINGSGLNEDYEHSTDNKTMWLSSGTGPQPNWIRYEFDRVYKLFELWVWNSNWPLETIFGLGLKEVTIEYSTDANDWTQLNGVHVFEQATGLDDYVHNTIIPFEGVVAKYVRITANSNWGGGSQYGLSEVLFFYKPVRPRDPSPEDEATDVALDAVLGWQAGRDADTHDVYFSTDWEAVVNGTVEVSTVSETSYEPNSLELGRTYYWKVDEVNITEVPTTWQGDLWSFSTVDYLVVDDFEDYNNSEPERIFDTWVDGWGIAENGSQVGYDAAPFAERSIVHSGSQSMPFFYDNTGAAVYSEALRTFDTAQDWTGNGIEMLTLFFRGVPPAFEELSPGNFLMSGTGSDIYQTTDEFRYAYKTLTGDGSITARIESIQDTHEWAKAAVMIRLGLMPLALQVHMAASPRNRVEWMYRPAAGATTTDISTDVDSTPLPHWVRLKRQGNTFIGEHSADGINWVSITEGDPASSSVDLQMPNTVHIGLVVTSHMSGVPCLAEFSEVSTEGNVTGQWQLADIGAVQSISNDVDQLYVTVEDSDGTAKVFEHPNNPNAVLAADWQQWDIPLSNFSDAGVDITAVEKIYIGAGDKTALQAGGAGTLYFDDMRLYPLPAESDPNAPPAE